VHQISQLDAPGTGGKWTFRMNGAKIHVSRPFLAVVG
jgi:hypothetical protein